MINFITDGVDNARTDLAVEFIPKCKTQTINKNVKRTDIKVGKELSKQLNRPEGNYITVESDAVKNGKRDVYDCISIELSNAIKKLARGKSCLIAALGNPNMTADALGKHVAERLTVTRHLNLGNDVPTLSCICPNVLGVTGIESFDIVKGVADRIKPDCIIVIDSLAGASTSRIASAFQVSDAGITPGSGVNNHRVRFDKESLGCRVISVGVPLVVYAATIITDALGGAEHDFCADIGSLVVTPKDIDMYVSDCASIVARAINNCYFGDQL